ncbi:hypothetical protein C8R43DRAFT_1035198 [Mycena crocata]|nr:hypothetical protein C8R43DRAFT_1035198 [Mycena crocata]
MPSAFDILGALSFAQGVLTVVATSFLAISTWMYARMKQVNDNDDAGRKLQEPLYTMLSANEPLLATNNNMSVEDQLRDLQAALQQLSYRGSSTQFEETIAAFSPDVIMKRLESILNAGPRTRARRRIRILNGARDAEIIQVVSSRMMQLEAQVFEARLTHAMSKVVEEAFQRHGASMAGGTAHRADCSIVHVDSGLVLG